MVAPTTTPERIEEIGAAARGFVYTVSLTGTTGERGELPRRVWKWASYPRISQHLKRAVLVAEDSAFWKHEGVDWEAVRARTSHSPFARAFFVPESTMGQRISRAKRIRQQEQAEDHDPEDHDDGVHLALRLEHPG